MRRALHWVVVLTLAGEALYCGFQIFVVLQPAGSMGPLLFSAVDVPVEVLVPRRLYAMEGWLAFIGLALYLGVTGELPGTNSQGADRQG